MFVAIDTNNGYTIDQSQEGESFEDFANRFLYEQLKYLDCDLRDLQFAAIIPHKFTITREID